MQNKRITKGEARLALGRAMKELENEYGLTSDQIANYTTKFSVNKNAPVNTRNVQMFDADKAVEILTAHYNMDEFNTGKRNILTNKEIIKNFILEGNQSKIIKSDIDGKLVVNYDKETRKVEFDGVKSEYTPYNLLEKIANTSSGSERVIKAFYNLERQGRNIDKMNFSVEVKQAWKDYKSGKIDEDEFQHLAGREQGIIFNTLSEGYKNAKEVSRREANRRRRK